MCKRIARTGAKFKITNLCTLKFFYVLQLSREDRKRTTKQKTVGVVDNMVHWGKGEQRHSARKSTEENISWGKHKQKKTTKMPQQKLGLLNHRLHGSVLCRSEY